jgi:hypothetical protein
MKTKINKDMPHSGNFVSIQCSTLTVTEIKKYTGTELNDGAYISAAFIHFFIVKIELCEL